MMKLKLPQSKFLKERLEKFSRKQRIVVVIFAAALIISGTIFVLAELGGYGVNGPATAPNSLDYGLVGYWDMEEGSGQTVKDKSGNGNDGTLGWDTTADSYDPVFVPGHDSSGANGTGLKFDGVGDVVYGGADDSLNIVNAFSLGAWLNPISGQWDSEIVTRVSGTPNQGFGFYYDSDGYFYLYMTTESTAWTGSYSPGIAFGSWQYVLVTYDNVNTAKFYLDGVLIKTDTTTWSGKILNSPGGDIYVGLPGWGGYPDVKIIDEVRMYNRAISADEVRLLFNQKKPILDLKFDEGSGVVFHDESFNNNDGSFGAGIEAPTWTTGVSGSGLLFDGTDDYAGIYDAPAPVNSDEMTMSFFMKDLGASQNWAAYVALYTSSWSGNDSIGIDMDQDEASDLVVPAVRVGGVNYDAPTFPLNSGFNFYTVVFSKSGNYRKSYLNGQLIGTVPGWPGGLSFANIEFGHNTNSVIDNFRVYQYARTDDDILLDYNDGMAAHLGENNQDLNRGLVGYWDMEEGGGQMIKDKSGNGNDGTLGANSSVGVDDPVFAGGHDSSGLVGTALDFDGTDDRVDAGSVDAINGLSSFSVSAWVKTDTLEGGENSLRYITAKEGLGAGNTAYILRLDTSVDLFEFYVAGADYVQARATTPVVAGVWYHVVGTYNGGYVKVYVNGQEEKSTAKTGVTGSTTEQVDIGHLLYDSASVRHWDGSLDEVRIYNRALSVDEIRQLYNQKKPVLDMKFDEGSGTVAHDESFNNNDGTIYNATWTSGKTGNALSLDGTGDYVGFSNYVFNSFEKAYTKSIWVKTSTANAYNLISGDAAQHVLYLEGGSIYMSNTWNDPQISVATNYSDNQWHHIEATYADNWGKIYFDGQLLREGALSNIPNNSATYVGAYGAANFFTGSLDNVRIYNYARTADEVLVDYNNGQAAHLGKNNQDLNSGLVGYWDMEEGIGQAVKDRTGNGNDGTPGTSSGVDAADPDFVAGHDSSGAVGAGLGCDGGSDYVDVGTGTSLSLTHTGAISLWIKPNSLTQDDFAGFVTKRNNVTGGTAANYSYSFHWRKGDNVIRLALSNGSTLNFATMPLLTDTNWHHIVGMWDGTNIKLYKDGVLGATPVAQVLDAQAGTTFNTAIGGNSFSTSAVNRQEFNGTIDEVRIYNRALTQDEINTLYNQKKPVLQLKMDEGSGTVARDDSFNNFDGTLGGDGVGTDLPIWTTGKFGSALNFDGSNDYVGLGSWDLTGAPRTVSLWVKSTDTPSSLTDKRFFSGNYFEIRFDGGYLNSRIFDSAFKQLNYTASNLSPGTWYHIVVTTSTNSLNLYVNGVVVNTNNTFAPTSHSDTLNIGAGYDSGNNFNGVLDDVRIYNYVRTASEVLTDYNNGLAAHLR